MTASQQCKQAGLKSLAERYRMDRKDSLLAIAGAAIVTIGLCVAGNDDAQEQERRIESYCENVRSGAWPDFNNNFDKICAN